MKKAFTLVELLVVLVIIGVLAAIAYPQYQQMVWKARVSKLLPLGGYLVQQIQLFHQETGTYPTDMTLGGLVPSNFEFRQDSSEELHTEWEWYQKGDISISCADGGEEDNPAPTTCRWVQLSMRQEDWSASLVLLFKAGNNEEEDFFEPYSVVCGGLFVITEPMYRTMQNVCRSLGGEPINDSIYFYGIK